MSRYRKRRGKSNSTTVWPVLVVVLAILAVFVFVGSGKFSGAPSESACGEREEDTKRNGYCLTTSKDHDELVIVTGNTQNSPVPNLDFTQGDLYNILAGVFYSTERNDTPSITIISAAGNNHQINYKDKYRIAQNIIASNNELKKLGKELNDAIKETPSEPGANYLGGILEAKNSFSTRAKNPAIIVVGSGYSDSGVLNFAVDDIFNRYWSNGDDGIISILSSNRGTKENLLEGVTVYWYHLGAVALPQTSLNQYKEDVKSIYEIVLRGYLGASSVKLDTGPATDIESVASLYSVQQTYVDELRIGDTFDVNENIGRFNPNSDTLIDSSNVEEKITSFARRFNPNSHTRLRLTGYIAYCADDSELGLTRANAIKSILIKLGVPENKIDTYGMPGSPPEKNNETYTCESKLPETERRTVRIEVVKE